MKNILLVLVSLFLFVSVSSAQTYVGPEKCLQCHNNAGLGDMTGWRTSMHANGYTTVLDDSRTMEDLYGMVNDYDKNGVDDFKDGLNFNDISSAFDAYKPNAPILAYSAADGYTIQMGDVTHKVFMTYGGSGLYKQRYMMKVETSEGYSNGYYVSPIQYNEKSDVYVVYHGSDWYDGNTPKYTAVSMLTDIANNSRNIAKNCSGCHSNGLEVWQDANNEWLMKGAPMENDALYAGMVNVYDIDGDGALDQINTTCERCHGPGSDHAATGDITKIINPNKLTAEEANNLCGMCHSRGKSLPNNTFGFPFHDDTLEGWEVGDIVSDIYTDGGGYWGDKVAEGPTSSTKHHQQFYDLYQSSKPTYQFHQVTCYECHDVHNDTKHHITKLVVETDSLGADIDIVTENDNNTLCLSCHATHGAFEDISVEMVADYDNNIAGIGAIVSAHSNHGYDPAGSGNSRCTKCHMPKVGKSAEAYDMHSHTFEVIPPQKTTAFAMPNACATSCHRGIENGPAPLFNTGADASLTDWTEAADIALADKLMESYGPTGSWWDHTVVSVEKVKNYTPDAFELSQNYPNPFNPTTNIDFAITEQGPVNITIYDAVGQAVEVLVNDFVPAGAYKITWNASKFASGVYFYRMEAGQFVQTQKMILLK